MNQPVRLIQSLRLWDVVAMNIVAVVGLRWITRSARLGAPLLATFISLGLTFVPPPGTESTLNYETNLIGQAALLLGLGMGLYRFARRRAA